MAGLRASGNGSAWTMRPTRTSTFRKSSNVICGTGIALLPGHREAEGERGHGLPAQPWMFPAHQGGHVGERVVHRLLRPVDRNADGFLHDAAGFGIDLGAV